MGQKLIEMQKEAVINCQPGATCSNCTDFGLADCMERRTADYMIANGVTVQQWIPVTERKQDLELVEVKAEDMDLFPCLVSKNTQHPRRKKIVTKAWYDGIGFMDTDCIDITNEVTHWMPLPQPPKEG